MRKKTVLSMILVIIFVASMPVTVFADTPSSSSFGEFTDSVDPFDYAMPPNGIYPFVYHGYEPYLTLEIDTSYCVEGRLYIYNASTNRVREVCEEQVILYTETKDYLYFMTQDKILYQTSYFSNESRILYQSTAASVAVLRNYFQTLYFIEDQYTIRFLNVATGATETAQFSTAVANVSILSAEEVLVTTYADEYFIYSLSESEITEELTESQALMAVNQAVARVQASKNHSETSGRSIFPSSSVTQTNDISLPLEEYPVNLVDNSQCYDRLYPRPVTWFHEDKSEGCREDNCLKYCKAPQCEGFARYVHDVYIHSYEDLNSSAAWYDKYHFTAGISFATEGDPTEMSVNRIKSFFQGLNTGAYVRYTKTTDQTPADGIHTIIFVSADNDGVWVYECNQNYTENTSGDYGCGIHLQYYHYHAIAAIYSGTLLSLNHTFTTKTNYSSMRHKVSCASCAGYVLQPHNPYFYYSYQNATQHAKVYDCCGRRVLVNHTATATYKTMASATVHKVYFSCCDGGYTQAHTFDKFDRCNKCGYVKVSEWSLETPVETG